MAGRPSNSCCKIAIALTDWSCAQTLTIDYVDTEQGRDELINSRLAYVSVSRGRYDALIYTSDANQLGKWLCRDVSRQPALETCHEMAGQDQGHAAANSEHHPKAELHDYGQSYGVEH
jgi:hypothetical protein